MSCNSLHSYTPFAIRCITARGAPIMVGTFVYAVIIRLLVVRMRVRQPTRWLPVPSIHEPAVPVWLVRALAASRRWFLTIMPANKSIGALLLYAPNCKWILPVSAISHCILNKCNQKQLCQISFLVFFFFVTADGSPHINKETTKKCIEIRTYRLQFQTFLCLPNH